ncbi:MAG TPA: cation transporter [Terriglobia bacterium]|nr:cation transporter [Terriglobia bacterium]
MSEQGCGRNTPSAVMAGHIRRLQIITLAWMLVECVVALAAAWRARSPVLLAFGADSFVELLSAFVVLLQFVPHFTHSEDRAARLAGILLFILAGVVTFTSVFTLFREVRPETSWMGIGIAFAALIVMPVLSRAKRNAGKATGNRALSADAVQSATCAYLAGITLAGLALNAVFHIRWIDPVAALVAVPIIWMEGRKALKGEPCGCSG